MLANVPVFNIYVGFAAGPDDIPCPLTVNDTCILLPNKILNFTRIIIYLLSNVKKSEKIMIKYGKLPIFHVSLMRHRYIENCYLKCRYDANIFDISTHL